MTLPVMTARQLLVAALLVASLPACQSGDSARPAPDQTAPTASLVSPSPTAAPTPPTVRVDALTGASQDTSTPGAYRFRVQVPQLDGLPPRSQAIDTLIKSRLQMRVDSFVDQARQAQGSPPLSELACTSRTVRLSVHLAVLRVDCAESQAGNPRPTTWTQTFDCDVASGRLLSLQDLFRPGASYLDVLSTTTRARLATQLGHPDPQTLASGTAPLVDNFKAFLLDRAGLDIVFAQYQVAPGDAGEQEVTVSYDELQRYLAPGIVTLLTD